MKYRLMDRLLLMSASKDWAFAKLEWELDHVYFDKGHECVCGKEDISEVCVLRNKVRFEFAEVGNRCVRNFIDVDIFDFVKMLRKIHDDEESSLPKEGIERVMRAGLLSDKDYEFYLHWCKRRASTVRKYPKVLKWRVDINRRVLARYVRLMGVS